MAEGRLDCEKIPPGGGGTGVGDVDGDPGNDADELLELKIPPN